MRAAFIQTIKRPLIANQTIEPTQIAGFNQFFDDPNLTISKRVGFALDQQLPANVYWGVELSARRLKIPVPEDTPKKERLFRTYFSAAPVAWFAATVGYEYESLLRDPESPSPEGFVDVKTNRLPIGILFFLAHGLSF